MRKLSESLALVRTEVQHYSNVEVANEQLWTYKKELVYDNMQRALADA